MFSAHPSLSLDINHTLLFTSVVNIKILAMFVEIRQPYQRPDSQKN
jgi:hypothetical protein